MSNCTLRDVPLSPDNVYFANTDIIVNVHELTPRWGHKSNIDVLFATGTTSEQQNDYLMGVLASAIAIFAVVMGWFVGLVILACLGPERVGIWSGRQRRRPNAAATTEQQQHTHNDDGDETEQQTLGVPATVYAKGEQQGVGNPIVEAAGGGENRSQEAMSHRDQKTQEKQSLRIARIVVLFCSVCITICVILMWVLGVRSLDGSANNAYTGLDQAKSLANEAISLIDRFLLLQDETVNSTLSFLNTVNVICPAVSSQLCSNLAELDQSYLNNLDQLDCNFAALPGLGGELGNIVDHQGDILLKNVYSFRSDVVEVQSILHDVDSTAQNFKWAYIVASVFAGLLLIMNIIIGLGVIMTWRTNTQRRQKALRRTCLKTLHNWLFVPIFGFLVIICWIFSMVFVIGSTVSADFCFDSPDDRVETLLLKYGDFGDSNAMIMNFLLFYLRGCPIDDQQQTQLTDAIAGRDAPLVVQLDAIRTELVDVLNFVSAANVLSEADFVQSCGADPGPLIQAAQELEDTMCKLGILLVDVQEYFGCDNWRPLYREVMYEGVCYNGNAGFCYIAITQFCVIFFAMIMLTLRAAFREGVDDDSDAAYEEKRDQDDGMHPVRF